ncbi:MAG: pyruvate formate lyase family protein [Anaerolineae bacterium]
MALDLDSARLQRLKATALQSRRQQPRLPMSTYFLDAYLANQDKPPILREALALEALWAQQPLTITPGQLFLGLPYRERFDLHAGTGLTLRTEGLATGILASREERRLAARLRSARRWVTRERLWRRLTAPQRRALQAGLVATQMWGGHQVVDYETVLQEGLCGLAARVEMRSRTREGLDADLHQALIVSVRALSTLIARYGEEARTRGRSEPSASRARELEIMAEQCCWLAQGPPRSFWEALQLAWFIHLATDCDSLGRLDQYIWPFYERERAAGATRAQAGYLLQALWLQVVATGGIQNLTIGGCGRDGSDATNELTYLCLEATRALQTPQPNLSLRIGCDAPKELLLAASETIAGGLGVPALYSDRTIIPALEARGIAPADARDYALAGCSQVVIPGRSHFGCDDGVFNAAKCLELALNDGRDPGTGRQIGPRTGKPEELRDFAGVVAALKRQIWHAAVLLGALVNASDRGYGEMCGYPLRTLLTQGCLEEGKGIWEGGALYNAIQAECVGITNTADALAAIKAVVYEDRALNLPQLVELLRRNWRGQETVRLYCRNRLPKFGNEDEFVDGLYADVARTVYGAVSQQPCRRGGMLMPGSVVFTYHIDFGAKTGATPDGRKRGEPLADSAGPARGAARRGPTAVLNSMLRFDQGLAPTCVVLNLMFDRTAFRPTHLADLVQTYFDRGGMQVQVNVADIETLRRAQRRPQDYPELTVRVGGFSAYFVELERTVQDEIITRTAL